MEKRRSPRLELRERVIVRLLGDGNGVTLPARIVNCSEGGLGIELQASLPVGAAIEIRDSDTLLLGEVSYCRQEPGRVLAGIRVEHGLFGLMELRKRAERFVDERVFAAAIIKG